MTDVDALNAEISALKSELSISTKEAQSMCRKLLRAQEENEATVKDFAARQEATAKDFAAFRARIDIAEHEMTVANSKVVDLQRRSSQSDAFQRELAAKHEDYERIKRTWDAAAQRMCKQCRNHTGCDDLPLSQLLIDSLVVKGHSLETAGVRKDVADHYSELQRSVTMLAGTVSSYQLAPLAVPQGPTAPPSASADIGRMTLEELKATYPCIMGSPAGLRSFLEALTQVCADPERALTALNQLISMMHIEHGRIAISIGGNESTGKSKFLSALFNLLLGYSAQGTTTRQPVEYTLQHCPSCVAGDGAPMCFWGDTQREVFDAVTAAVNNKAPVPGRSLANLQDVLKARMTDLATSAPSGISSKLFYVHILHGNARIQHPLVVVDHIGLQGNIDIGGEYAKVAAETFTRFNKEYPHAINVVMEKAYLPIIQTTSLANIQKIFPAYKAPFTVYSHMDAACPPGTIDTIKSDMLSTLEKAVTLRLAHTETFFFSFKAIRDNGVSWLVEDAHVAQGTHDALESLRQDPYFQPLTTSPSMGYIFQHSDLDVLRRALLEKLKDQVRKISGDAVTKGAALLNAARKHLQPYEFDRPYNAIEAAERAASSLGQTWYQFFKNSFGFDGAKMGCENMNFHPNLYNMRDQEYVGSIWRFEEVQNFVRDYPSNLEICDSEVRIASGVKRQTIEEYLRTRGLALCINEKDSQAAIVLELQKLVESMDGHMPDTRQATPMRGIVALLKIFRTLTRSLSVVVVDPHFAESLMQLAPDSPESHVERGVAQLVQQVLVVLHETIMVNFMRVLRVQLQSYMVHLLATHLVLFKHTKNTTRPQVHLQQGESICATAAQMVAPLHKLLQDLADVQRVRILSLTTDVARLTPHLVLGLADAESEKVRNSANIHSEISKIAFGLATQDHCSHVDKQQREESKAPHFSSKSVFETRPNTVQLIVRRFFLMNMHLSDQLDAVRQDFMHRYFFEDEAKAMGLIHQWMTRPVVIATQREGLDTTRPDLLLVSNMSDHEELGRAVAKRYGYRDMHSENRLMFEAMRHAPAL